jgi:hypothetical protein
MSADPYAAYLDRFRNLCGPLEVGAYGKWKGKLIRKLSPVEFAAKNDELTTLQRTYQGILERGDTLNDAITKLLREHQAELLLEEEL